MDFIYGEINELVKLVNYNGGTTNSISVDVNGTTITANINNQYLVSYVEDYLSTLDYTDTDTPFMFVAAVTQSNGRVATIKKRVNINDIEGLLNRLTILTNAISAEQSRATEAETQLQHSIDAETTNRENIDNLLQANIDAEISRATQAEQTLTTDLTSEVNNRISADTNERTRATQAEQSLANALSTETTNRENADSTLQVNLNTEITDRIADVDAEESRAKAAESSLDAKIDIEIYNRETADTALQNSIDTNISNVIGNASANYNTLGKLETAIGNVSGTFTQDLAGEVEARTGADTTLQQNINTEISDRQAAISGIVGTASTDYNTLGKLETAIKAESTRASGVENTISGNLTTEISNRQTADTALGGRIDTEIANRESADTTLNNRIGTEISDRQSAITNLVDGASTDYNTLNKLETAIKAESTRATGAESSLSGSISALETAMASSITTNAITVGTINGVEVGNDPQFTDTTYTAGEGIAITNNVISNTRISAEWGNITGTMSNQTDLQSALDAKMVKGVDYVTAGRLSNTVAGSRSTAEGYENTASGTNTHAEGLQNIASGNNAHAEGYDTQASGNNSHAEGASTVASGLNSHAEGLQTIAAGDSQHVFGQFNVADNNDTYIEIVGKGTTNNARSNARTLDWNGNEVLAGKLTVGAGPVNDSDVATKQYVDNSVESITVPVTSVNTKTGNVVLTASDVGALSSSTTIPSTTSELTNDSGFITSSDIPVTSVNTKTGAVVLTASDVGALPTNGDEVDIFQLTNNYIPDTGSYTDVTSTLILEAGEVAIESSGLFNSGRKSTQNLITRASIAPETLSLVATIDDSTTSSITVGIDGISISNLVYPANSNDAANKKYVDDTVDDNSWFIATYGTTTLQELIDVFDSGSNVKIATNYGGVLYVLDTFSGQDVAFYFTNVNGSRVNTIVCNNNGWNYAYTDLASEGYVDTAISSIDTLPTQTGQNGKFLTTNGTDASWALPYIDVILTIDEFSSITCNYTKSEIINLINNNILIRPVFETAATNSFDYNLQYVKDSNNNIIFYQVQNNSIITYTYTSYGISKSETSIESLPSQTGQGGKFLTTDGTNVSWGTVNNAISTVVTLTAANWTGHSQTITVSGVTSSSIVQVSPVPSSYSEYSNCGVYCSSQGTDSLTFTTLISDPANNISVNVIIWG